MVESSYHVWIHDYYKCQKITMIKNKTQLDPFYGSKQEQNQAAFMAQNI